jgi:hypothetical protein
MNLPVNEKSIFFTLSVGGTIRSLLLYSLVVTSGERESERCQYPIVAKVVLTVEFFCQSGAKGPSLPTPRCKSNQELRENQRSEIGVGGVTDRAKSLREEKSRKRGRRHTVAYSCASQTLREERAIEV